MVSPCFDQPTLVSDIEEWLERSQVDARLHVRVTQREGVLYFVIGLEGQPDLVRQFDELPPDCVGQRHALALSIALAIDAMAPRSGNHVSAPGWVFTADALAGTPYPDAITWGATLGMKAAVTPRFWPGAGVVFTTTGDQPVESGEPARFSVRRVLARLDGCFQVPFSEMASLFTCGGFWLGAATVAAHGLTTEQSSSHFWWAATGTLELHLRFTSAFGLHLGTDVFGALRPSTVRFLDSGGNFALERNLPDFGAMVRLGPTLFF